MEIIIPAKELCKRCQKYLVEVDKLCPYCQDENDEQHIYKTIVLKKYMLNEIDISNLSYKKRGNPHGSGHIYLYKIKDIKNVFCKKYNISYDQVESKINEISLIKQQKKDKLEIKKLEKIKKRNQQLDLFLIKNFTGKRIEEILTNVDDLDLFRTYLKSSNITLKTIIDLINSKK